MSTTMWPSSAAAPTQPRYRRPPSTSPPPIPVPIVSIATSVAPFAAPATVSAQTAQLASLSTSTGSPRRSDMRSAKGRSASGRLTAWTAIPVRRSNVQGIPKPTASTSPANGIASLFYGFDHRLDEGGLVQPEGLPPRSMVDGEPFRIDGSGQEFRPAEIDADHTAGGHSDHDTPFAMDEEKPNYTRYRSRPKLFGKRSDGARDGLDDLRGGHPRPEQGGKRKLRDRFTFWRVLGYVALAAVGWVLVSLLLFLISAQVQRQKVNDAAGSTLSDSGFPLTSPNNILVLGSDARTKGTKEPGANVGGPSRSDTILLMRVGGGKASRLSIPRDTFAEIPGHGTDKINAAYAYGGPGLAVKTVEGFLGVKINHLVEVNFENFPDFIDSLGGINYTGGCVISRINGGYKQRRLHAAAQPGQEPPRRRAGARARPHAQERVQPGRERPHPRAPPAEDPRLHQVAAAEPHDLPAAPARLLAGAEGGPLGHGRPRPARAVRRDRDRRLTVHARAQGRARGQRPARLRRGQAARGASGS